MSEIKFSQTQQRLCQEVKMRHDQAFVFDLQAVLAMIFQDLGIEEDVKAGKLKIQLRNDYSGLDVIEEPQPPDPKKE